MRDIWQKWEWLERATLQEPCVSVCDEKKIKR